MKEDVSPPNLEICDYCDDYFPILNRDKDWIFSKSVGNYIVFDGIWVCSVCREKIKLISNCESASEFF